MLLHGHFVLLLFNFSFQCSPSYSHALRRFRKWGMCPHRLGGQHTNWSWAGPPFSKWQTCLRSICMLVGGGGGACPPFTKSSFGACILYLLHRLLHKWWLNPHVFGGGGGGSLQIGHGPVCHFETCEPAHDQFVSWWGLVRHLQTCQLCYDLQRVICTCHFAQQGTTTFAFWSLLVSRHFPPQSCTPPPPSLFDKQRSIQVVSSRQSLFQTLTPPLPPPPDRRPFFWVLLCSQNPPSPPPTHLSCGFYSAYKSDQAPPPPPSPSAGYSCM